MTGGRRRLLELRDAQQWLVDRYLRRPDRRVRTVRSRRAGARSTLNETPNVHALAIGAKRVMAAETNTPAVIVFVKAKLPRARLAARDVIPATIDGLPTDVVVCPAALAHGPARRRPPQPARAPRARRGARGAAEGLEDAVHPGVSAAHERVNVGTLGAFVRKAPGGPPLALGNNHVFANVNQAAPGDDLLHPSRGDGASARRIADLLDFEPLRFNGAPNLVDCAVAALDASVRWDPRIPIVGVVRGILPPAIGLPVCKQGRTTEFTVGRIAALNWTGDVTFAADGRLLVARFVDQIFIEPVHPFSRFGMHGDSGALVAERVAGGVARAVGLYFAGPADGSYGLANPIKPVLDRLEVTLATPDPEA
jgi:hypothetical protein